MTAWRLPVDCLTIAWWLPDNCWTTAWRQPDDWLMTVSWLSHDYWGLPDDCTITALILADNCNKYNLLMKICMTKMILRKLSFPHHHPKPWHTLRLDFWIDKIVRYCRLLQEEGSTMVKVSWLKVCKMRINHISMRQWGLPRVVEK